MGPERAEPLARRLRLPGGYSTADDGGTLLPWSSVSDRIARATTYWLATMRPDGRPHVTPIWGVWIDRALYFNGIPTARWARNMAANPAIAIHLESGSDVVIIEGAGEDVPVLTDADIAARIVAAWGAKYGTLIPEPATEGIYRLRPSTVRAWSRFPDDATIWRFVGSESAS